MLGSIARFGGIPMSRRSSSLQNHDLWAWIVYPPRCSYERGSPVDFSLGLCLVGLYDNSKPCLGIICDNIQPGFTETGSSQPIKFQDIPFSVIVHAYKAGYTWAPCFAHFRIPPHFNTHARVHCMGLEVFRCSEALLPMKP